MKYLLILVLLFTLCLSAEKVIIEVEMVEIFEVSPDSTYVNIFQTYSINQFTWTDTLKLTKPNIQDLGIKITQKINSLKVRQLNASEVFTAEHNQLKEEITKFEVEFRRLSDLYDRLE